MSDTHNSPHAHDTPTAPEPPRGVATGIGSMPGDDPREAMRVVAGELSAFPHLPEIPGRSQPASMIGRATALLVDLAVDLQPAGWRLADAPGAEQRRAAALLAQDLDVLEEELEGFGGPLKVQVAGPWTLAANVERPRGDRVLADSGARRDVAQSVAAGITEHVADVRRRVPGAHLVVQVDEPALPAVLTGDIPTASGFQRHRHVDAAAAEEALAWYVEAITAAEATPAVHCCGRVVPIDLLRRSGFRALSCDIAAVSTDRYDEFAALIDSDVGLWLGVVPPQEPDTAPTDSELTDRVLTLVDRLGFDPDATAGRCVITPACGFAGAGPSWTRTALRLAGRIARHLSPQGGKMGT